MFFPVAGRAGAPALATLLVSVMVLTAVPASAQTLAGFNKAVATAYAPVRTAAGYLRTGNTMPASLELDAAAAAWRRDVAPLAGAPPPLFAADPAFADSLSALETTLRAALAAATRDDAAASAAAVATFRADLSALRRRNGVYLLPDCVLDLSAAMDVLWHWRHHRPDFDDRASLSDLAQAVGALAATADRCESLAGDTERADPAYGRLMGGLIASLVPLRQAIRDGDHGRFLNLLREQRSLERLIAMQFG